MTQHVAHRKSDEIHELRAEIERLNGVLKAIECHSIDHTDACRMAGKARAAQAMTTTITGRSESDADIAAILRGYVDRFELTSPMVKQMMLDAAAEIERLKAENAEQKAELQKLYSVLTIDPQARAALEPKP